MTNTWSVRRSGILTFLFILRQREDLLNYQIMLELEVDHTSHDIVFKPVLYFSCLAPWLTKIRNSN